MRWMRNSLLGALGGIFIILLAQVTLAQMRHETSVGETKVVDGIKATFKVTPSMSMVDIVLSDAKTGKEITKAKVTGVVTNPDGTTQTKELVGGKMGEQYSFMNTVDLSRKGKYSLDIRVEVDKKKVSFNFGYEVK